MKKKILKVCSWVIFCACFLVGSATTYAQSVALNLDTAIQMALRNNPKTRIADGNLITAEGDKKQTIGSFGPQINFSHSSTRSYQYTYDVFDNTFNNNARVTLPIYTGGRRRAAIESSRRNYEIAEWEIERTDQEVKLDATTAYFNVLQYRNLVALNRESVERLEEHLRNVEAQYSVGVVARVDVLRSQVELADAQQQLIIAENGYEVSVATLNNVVGLPHHTQTVLAEELAYEEYNKSLEDCLAFSFEHKPEIIQAEKAVSAAKNSITVARSGYLPSVSVGGNYGWGKSDFPGDRRSNWQVSATLDLNIFDSNVTRGAVDSAQGNLLQREATFEQTKDNVFLAVRSNYLSLREAEKRIYTASVTVETAREDYMIAQVRYQAGVGTNTDVLDAQVALTTAQTNYVQALYDYNTSWANLENAMGVPVYPYDEFVLG